MTSEQQVGELLEEEFPPEMIRTHQHKGGLSYIPIAEVITRLNRVFGHGQWSSEIIRLWEGGEKTTETGVFPTCVMAHVRLTGTIKDTSYQYDGIGGQAVKFSKTGPVDLGDEYKGAASDALKKAAQSLGVGIHLARQEDAKRYDEDSRKPKASLEIIQTLKEAFASLKASNPENYRILIQRWNEHTGGKHAGAGGVTEEEAEAALSWVQELSK